MSLAIRRAPGAVIGADTAAAMQWLVGILGVLAVCYTGGVALATAHGVPLGFGSVALIEMAMLATGIIAIFATGVRDNEWPVVGFVYFMLALALIVSIMNDRPMIETVRQVLIIGVFSLLGQRAEEETLHRIFLITTAVVLAVLALEVVSTTAYVWAFQPQQFFGATRGYETSEWNNTGLFNTTAGFAGRFSFGIFDSHRTSSIFMEQVSNANYACVAALYLSAFWNRIGKLARLLYVVTIVAILVTTNARFASMLVVLVLIGHFLFVYAARWAIPLISLAIAAGVVFVTLVIPSGGDTLLGRITLTGQTIGRADAGFLFGADAWRGLGQADSGYAYIIGTTGVFGLAALWCYLNLYPRVDDVRARRLACGLALYFFGQLVVSGTSLLSIKTAGLLWILVGHVRANRDEGARIRGSGR